MSESGSLSRYLNIEAAERARVGWLFLHSLCVGAFVSFLFCAGNALFLSHYDAAMLPWGYVVSGLLGTSVVHLFARLGRQLSFPRLLLAQLGFLFFVLLGLYAAGLLLPAGSRRVVAFVLFVFIGPALTVVNLEFWSLARQLFDVRQSKRFNPLVATGEALASIAGFFLVPLLSPSETLHLLLPALAGLAGSAAIVILLSRLFAAEWIERQDRRGARRSGTSEAPRDHYFALMAAVMGLAVAAHYLVDFAFLSELKKHYSSAEQVAAFIGVFYGAVKVLDLLLKSLVSGRLVQLFGLGLALRVLPAALLISVVPALLVGGTASTFFLFVALTKLLWPVLRKAVFDPAFKVLYQPLPEAESLGLQSRIDGGVRQLGTFLIGLVLLVLSSGAVGPRPLLLGLVLVLGLWVALIGPLYDEYRKRLVDTLSFRQATPMVSPAISELRAWLSRVDGGERRTVIEELEDLDPQVVAAVDGRLDAAGLADLERAFARQQDSALRRRILVLYAVADDARMAAWLVEKLGFPDPEVRLAAIEGLVARGYRADGEVAAGLRNDIEHLAGDMTWNLAALADLHHGLRQQPGLEKVCRALRGEIEQQRRQVFLLLALLFDPAAIALAREGLQPGADGDESKANALELLETLISDEIRSLVLLLVEDLPEATALKRLRRIFPSERCGWRERLGAMLQRSPSTLSLETQAVALEVIGESCAEGEVAEELVVSLFHPDPLLQEVAAAAIARLDLEQCRRRLAKLAVDVRGRLLGLIGEHSSGLPATTFDRLRLLDTVEVFRELPRSVKRAVAASLAPAKPGESFGAEGETVLVVAFGPRGTPASAMLMAAGELKALERELEKEVLYIEGYRWRELLKRHVELVLAMLRLRPSTGSVESQRTPAEPLAFPSQRRGAAAV